LPQVRSDDDIVRHERGLRLLVKDDPAQCERAARAFRRAVEEGGAFFSATVIVEIAWVLRVAFKLDRGAIAKAIRNLVTAAGVTVENDAIVRRALDAFEIGSADFSDYFIRESSREAGALPVLTFDERFARGQDVEMVPRD
jgi:predicted nucleic-acid-binding protein